MRLASLTLAFGLFLTVHLPAAAQVSHPCNATGTCDSTNVTPMTGNFVVPLANQERETPVVNNTTQVTQQVTQNVTNVQQVTQVIQYQPVYSSVAPRNYCGRPAGVPDYANACGHLICSRFVNGRSGYLASYDYSEGSWGNLVCL